MPENSIDINNNPQGAPDSVKGTKRSVFRNNDFDD
jgi:hypothetical protein